MTKFSKHSCVALVAAICMSLISIFADFPSLNYYNFKDATVPKNWTRKIDSRWEHSHPVNLSYCLSLRLPGIIKTLNLEDNLHILKPFSQNKSKIRVGISIFEDNNEFWGLKGGVLHLYHFIEFLLYAYTALIQIANTVATPPNEGGGITSLAESLVEVPWIHAPYLARDELKGSHHTNQIIAGLALRQTPHVGAIPMKGLEDNDNPTQDLHPSFKGKEKEKFSREILRRLRIPGAKVRYENWRKMTDAADVVVFINRFQCDHRGISQMHAKLPDPGYFPGQAWSSDIGAGLLVVGESNSRNGENIQKDKFVACYIDRQGSDRRMPDEEHHWLIKTLSDHPNVFFRHLRMEQYLALKQFQIARTCDLLVGVHGNGLTHQLWMKRGGNLVEYFWDNEFVWCYTILALLMQHDFLILWRGKPVDSQRLQDRDVDLQQELNSNLSTFFEPETARRSFTEFLEKALNKFNQQHQTVHTS